MDIAYLQWLQELRLSAAPIVTDFFLLLSAIIDFTPLLVLVFILYWCVDKRSGRFLLFTFNFGVFVNQLVKNTFCVYRPWIRSPDIHPAEAALPKATGYSFPSGHTAIATTLFGGIAYNWRKKLPALSIACCVFVALVALSRNFLSVHTPQDVIVGFLLGTAVVFAAHPILDWIDAEVEGRDLKVFLAGIASVIIYVLYIALKPYPMDYDAAGNLLVDPVAMQLDCYKAAGAFLGFVVGWFLERRLVGFETTPDSPLRQKVIRCVIGVCVLGLIQAVASPFKGLVDIALYSFVKNFLSILCALFLSPLAFNAFERRTNKTEPKLAR